MLAGPGTDLCQYAEGGTTAVFDSVTGNYSFQSVDFATFGTQTLTFAIRGSTGTQIGAPSE